MNYTCANSHFTNNFEKKQKIKIKLKKNGKYKRKLWRRD